MARRSLPTFYPPGDRRVANLIGRYGLLPVMKTLWKLGRVEIGSDDAARLTAACAGPSILCPNHPSLQEPVVVWEVLQRLGIPRNFAMALDTYQVLHPLSWLLMGMGCYSIRRATPDRQAFATTRQLLCAGRCVVIFPEGETSGLNDKLLAFHEGTAQLGFWGLADRAKQGLPANVKLVPLVAKYLYDRDMTDQIDVILARLEEQVGLARSSHDRYQRLREVGFATARAIEQEYGLAVPEGLSLDEHIETVMTGLLERLARGLELELNPDEPANARVRRLFVGINANLREAEPAATPYAARLRADRLPAWRSLEAQAARLQTFQAVRDGYVASHPSAERYLDVLGRLEIDLVGAARRYGRRRVVVRVGEPIDLEPLEAGYRDDRRAAVATVTAELQARSQALVDELTHLAPTIG